jgi:hypothetical protein
MLDKDVWLILIGTTAGFLSAALLAILKTWLSTRETKFRQMQTEADERVGLVFEFLSSKIAKDNSDQVDVLPKVAWLILDQYTGPSNISLRKLKLVTQRILPLSEIMVVLKEITTIGRSSLNDFVLNSSEVNKIHALIRYESGRYVYYDLGGDKKSSRINGQKVERTVLQDGDHIDVQGFVIIYAEHKSTIKKTAPLATEEEIRLLTANH